MKKEFNQHKIKEFLRSYGTFFALLAIILVFSALRPSTFATLGNFVNITKQMSILAVCALGATLIMCVEEFDLSIGTIASFGGILAAKLAVAGCSFIVCLLAATAACALLGYMNGFIVTKFGVMSFIITLASSTMIYGFSYWLSDGATIFSGIPKSFSALGTGKALGITSTLQWLISELSAHFVASHELTATKRISLLSYNAFFRFHVRRERSCSPRRPCSSGQSPHPGVSMKRRQSPA